MFKMDEREKKVYTSRLTLPELKMDNGANDIQTHAQNMKAENKARKQVNKIANRQDHGGECEIHKKLSPRGQCHGQESQCTKHFNDDGCILIH